MKSIIIKFVIASGLLNLISLIERESVNLAEKCLPTQNCADEIEQTKGFPLSFVEETAGASSTSSFDYPSFAANWIFWAIIAVAGFFVLRWVWDRFSRLIFYLLIALGIASYFGVLTVW